jgi:hypothetical protein
MLKSEVETMLAERPFLPLAIYLVDRSVVDVPFAHVAIPFGRTLLVLLGMSSERSPSATGKVEIAYERIHFIARRRLRWGPQRTKRS